ncbi:MAG: hypothetical protein MRY23_01920 [Pelagibacteraceae bacterium]|nr:hypothetical protein [Pelagibacteraceae bacterium]MCI5079655.1 hypothetical protein [Pelagibacteraceae bacterium]
MKKLIVEFENSISLKEFDDNIDLLVETFPKQMSIVIKVENHKDKSVATLWPNTDTKSKERKVWQIQEAL